MAKYFPTKKTALALGTACISFRTALVTGAVGRNFLIVRQFLARQQVVWNTATDRRSLAVNRYILCVKMVGDLAGYAETQRGADNSRFYYLLQPILLCDPPTFTFR